MHVACSEAHTLEVAVINCAKAIWFFVEKLDRRCVVL